ncbi:DEAD/DEAH box helicase [Micromonospora sp. WMMA1923]|uniref:DEAD/DEAH box helicase n=1 Tax=Micromonospora sp. WMMA1923 TaxID=3404125 RepID=UPI003B961FF9
MSTFREEEQQLLPGMPHPRRSQTPAMFEVPNEGDDSFRAVPLLPRYSPAKQPLDTFYIPLLKRAKFYDRAVGYWSATELKFAAQGLAHFIARGGTMRLIVGAQLHQADVNAVLAGKPLEEVLAERLLADPDLEGAKIVESEHLAVLAWMAKHERLHIRVGVPTDGRRLLTYAESGRYFHTKYGIFTDVYSNRVAFDGSNNATVSGWIANHETFDVYPSWKRQVWEWNGQASVEDFQRHWEGQPDDGWVIVPLPTAVRKHLVTYAPPSLARPIPPQPRQGPTREEIERAWAQLLALSQAPRESQFTAVGTAQAEPLPHQARLIHRVVSSFPRGYVFADEVGLGKTIEAGLVIRELLLSGKAQKVLLLVPASVIKQWQDELHDKISLDVPRYTGTSLEDRHGNVIDSQGGNPWSAFPIVLGSSHLARRRSRRRQILDAGPWDVVLVDEAHHARRRGSKPADTPNSLLALLLEMRARESWQALYLASATPMQMHPHEAWDLIALLGLPGRWGRSAQDFTGYYERLRTAPSERDWATLTRMLGDYFSDPKAERDTVLERQIQDDLGWVESYKILGLDKTPLAPETARHLPPAAAEWADKWLRRHTPMRDRVFRNTRQTLRAYQQAGVISPDVIIPYRHVDDEFIPLAPHERKLYNRIEEYIRRHYNTYKASKSKANQALGFIMTVYRRRLTSSFEAIRCSLRRRLEVLEQGKNLNELLAADDQVDLEDALFDPEEFDATADLLRGEITELRDFIADLEKITGEDTKATQLVNDIRDALNTYASVVVFTQYTDTLDYVRERLVMADYRSIGCYSGRGGEIYNPETRAWGPVTRTELKELFRSGEVTVLLGTDSMSEGLNLQTAGRLINYDMPWNLMRVEQRIGRVDRIGTSYRDIRVTNYFYADTIEQRVYEGIAADFSDFTDIIGNAQPVLGTIEKTIQQLALTDIADRDREADAAVGGIKSDIAELAARPVQTSDLGDTPEIIGHIEAPPVLVGSVTLADLERTLTGNLLTRACLTSVEGRPGVYELALPAPPARAGLDDRISLSLDYGSSPSGPAAYERLDVSGAIEVTFSRAVADTSRDDVILLTFGSPHLAALLPAPTGEDKDS